MAAKHTPGPWRQLDECVLKDIGDCAHLVATVEFWAEETLPNARLIAAAPNLAHQLLAAANYIDALGGDSRSYRQAYAAATGEGA